MFSAEYESPQVMSAAVSLLRRMAYIDPGGFVLSNFTSMKL